MSPSNDQTPGVRRAAPDRPQPRRRFLLLMVSALLLAVHASGQTPAAGDSAVTNLEMAQNRAAELKQPLLVLVAESDASRADHRALVLVDSLAAKELRDNTVVLSLDLAISRNRATAARFHITSTPVLLCLSSRGIIISRDDEKLTRRLVLQRVDEARQQSPHLDAQLAQLESAAGAANNLKAQFALTDFLLAHQNDFEAIPRLAAIAHSNANAPADRITAWVALARAHLWIAEPEKCRHEAEALLAALGPVAPEAQAGGELVLGLQDTALKRPARARQEFEQAVAAAPESSYGQEAARALAALPRDPSIP